MGKLSFGKRWMILCLFCLVAAIPSGAASFAMFPQAGRLVSPDGRYEVRNMEPSGAVGEFIGTPRSLWVTELTTGRSRKLCDYLGIAAVTWSNDHSILITQYVGKKASRALMFSEAGSGEAIMLDSGTLTQLLSVDWRPSLRENDHLFVEATSVEHDIFSFRIWGYGKRDPGGFRWKCQYRLSDGLVSCANAN